ncbi:MAG: GH-E family nuclease [Clostridia bacterium]|nr:GH-E family nuclease [Clostridia bacterium]
MILSKFSKRLNKWLAVVLTVVLLLMSSLVIPAGVSGPAAVIAPLKAYAAADSSLIAYYKFDDNTNDSSGNGHNGTQNGGVQYVRGVSGKAAQFDGVDDYINAGTFSESFLNGMTVSVWARFDTTAAGHSQRIIDFGQGQASNNIIFAQYNTGSDIYFEAFSSSESKVIAQNAIETGIFKNYVASASRTADGKYKVNLYVNGVKQSTSITDTSVPAAVTRTLCYIGKSNWNMDTLFKGAMDELKIYNKALTEEEVKLLQNTPLINKNGFKNGGISTQLYESMWNPWENLAGTTDSNPCAVSWSHDRTDVFVKGKDNALWHRLYDGVWHNWRSLGGTIVSDPTAVSWSEGRIDVFAKGSDGNLGHIWYDTGKWNSWESLGIAGGGIASPASVVSQGQGKLDVFIRGSDNALYQKSYANNSWGNWVQRSTGLTSDPCAVVRGSGKIDVFARGAGNALYCIRYQNNAWGAWTSLGGVISSKPNAVSWGEGRVDVFARGTDNAMWHMCYDGAAWGTWKGLGTVDEDGGIDSEAAAVSLGSGKLNVFARGKNYMYHQYYDGSWHGWETFGGKAKTNLCAVSNGAGRIGVFAGGEKDALMHRFWQGTDFLTKTDIGLPSPSGTVSYKQDTGEYTVAAGGTDIEGITDQFTFLNKKSTGDAMCTVRLNSQTNTNPWAKAGLMFRENLNANSKFVDFVATPGNGLNLQWRSVTGGGCSSIPLGAYSFPLYLRLIRNGTTFTAYTSQDGITWGNPLGTIDVNMGEYAEAGVCIASHSNGTASTVVFDSVQIDSSPDVWRWSQNDIGGPAPAGVVSYERENGRFTISAGGTDIEGGSDQFTYESQEANGDATIIARVTSQTNTNPWAKAGIMFRESNEANSKCVQLVVTPGNGLSLQWRDQYGYGSQSLGACTLPVYIKLVRNNAVFTAYKSNDGVAWGESLRSHNDSQMPANIRAGLCVTSHNNGNASTAQFDNVSVSSLPIPWKTHVIGSSSLGTASYNQVDGKFILDNKGAGIGGTSDQFTFADQEAASSVSGRISVAARISSKSSGSKAGIMIRESTAADSKFVSLVVDNTNLYMQWRDVKGSTIGQVSIGTYTGFPIYLKLEKSNEYYYAYRSADGVSWGNCLQSHSQSTAFGNIRAGLCLTSCSTTTAGTAAIDCVDVEHLTDSDYKAVKLGLPGVYAPTGNYSRTDVDMNIPSPAMDISMRRTYNSEGGSHYHWGFGTGWTFGYQGEIEAYNEYDAVKVFLPDGSMQAYRKNSDYGKYISLSGSNYILTKPKDNQFEMEDKSSHIKYVFGDIQSNSHYLLTQIIDRNNNTITINYSNNRIQNIVDQMGRVYDVTYEILPNIMPTYYGITSITGYTDLSRRVSRFSLNYTYDDSGRLHTASDAIANNVMTYIYDSKDELTQVKDRKGNSIVQNIIYDTSQYGKVTSITDKYNCIHTYDYTGNVGYFGGTGKVAVTDDPSGTAPRRKIIYYNQNYNVIAMADALGKMSHTDYKMDSGGYDDVKWSSDSNRDIKANCFDINDNPIEIVDDDGSRNTFEYDTNTNNLTRTGKLENEAFDGQTGDMYAQYFYDSSNNIKKAVKPLNGTDVYKNDGSDDNSKFAITLYDYTTAGSISGLLRTVTDPEGNITTYKYDSNGYLSSVVDPENNATKYTYNRFGCLEMMESPLGSSYTTVYTYDKNGRLVKKVTSGDGTTETTRIVYDANGNIVKLVQPKAYQENEDNLDGNDYDSDNSSTGYWMYFYYIFGKVGSVVDPERNTINYSYNKFGKLTDKLMPDGRAYRYEYDVLDRPIKVYYGEGYTTPNGLLEEYTYVPLLGGKEKITVTKHSSDPESSKTVYVYDHSKGRLLEKHNPNGAAAMAEYTVSGAIKTASNEKGWASYYQYDGMGRMISRWTPSTETDGIVRYRNTQVVYDKAGKVQQVKTGKNEVEAFSTPLPLEVITQNYEYYKDGKLLREKDSAGRKTEYYYDAGRNLTKVDTYINYQDRKNTIEYTYNHMDKPVKKEIHVEAGDIYGNTFGNTTDSIYTTSYTYDSNGNMATATTPDNVTTTYTYDQMDRLTVVSQPGLDENNQAVIISTSTTYDWEGKPLTVTDANNRTTTYKYNMMGWLETVTDALNGVTAYYYDIAGRMTATVSPRNYGKNAVNGTDTFMLSDMNRTEYTYDAMGRIKTVKEKYYEDNAWKTVVSDSYKYDECGNVIKELDALGYESGTGSGDDEKIKSGYGTEYGYNIAGELVYQLDPQSKNNGLPYTEKYTYDAAGRPVEAYSPKGTGNGSELYYLILKSTYDDAGNILSVTSRKNEDINEQTLKTFSYDLLGNVTSKTDGNNNTTTYTYNAFNQVRSVVYPGDSTIATNTVYSQYDSMGRLVKIWDLVDNETQYSYNSQGLMLSTTVSKTNPYQSFTVSSRYDKNGNMRYSTDGNGNTTEYQYDKLNRLTSKKITTQNINTQANTENITIYGYDANSNNTSITDRLVSGETTMDRVFTNTYDPLDRLTQVKDPLDKIVQVLEYNDNGAQTKVYDALGWAAATKYYTQYQYDRNNRLTVVTDPLNHTTSRTYDNAGNISTSIDGRNNTIAYGYDEFDRLKSVKNALNQSTTYTYDLNGNMLAQTDGRGYTTTYQYNAADLPARKIDPGGSTTAPYTTGKTTGYNYNAEGTLSSMVDRNGQTTSYSYGVDSRLVLQSTTGGTGSDVSISYTYDNNGNRLTMSDSTGTTSYTYDAMNRMTSKTVPQYPTQAFKYEYDNILADTSRSKDKSTDPKNNVTEWTYDKAHRLVSTYDGADTTNFLYYDNGALQKVTYPGGAYEEYTYYNDGLLNKLRNKKSDNTIIDMYTYNYDNAHNLSSKEDSTGATSYSYDASNRLYTVTEPGSRVTTYGYDAAGNRQTEALAIGGVTDATSIYSYDERNRLTQLTYDKAVGSEKDYTKYYVYDNNGNQTRVEKQPYGGTRAIERTNTFDKLDRLTATEVDGRIVANTYNGDGLRVSKVSGNHTTQFLYDGMKPVLELDASGNQTARNVYGSDTLLSRKVDTNNPFYMMYNGHGDVTALVDSTSTIQGTYYYDAFGKITASSGTANNPFRYSGYMYDSETALGTDTGMYYLNARFYDANTARFLQEDSYTGDPSDPLSLNLYTYCTNNPLIYTDPTGHFFNFITAAFGAAVGAVVGVASVGFDSLVNGNKHSWKDYLGAAVGGAITGAAAGFTMGGSLVVEAAVAVTAGVAASAAGNVAQQLIATGNVDAKEVGYAALGGAAGGLGGAAGGALAGEALGGAGVELTSSLAKVGVGAVGGATGGAAADIAVQIASKGDIDWSQVGQSAAFGGLVGGSQAGAEHGLGIRTSKGVITETSEGEPLLESGTGDISVEPERPALSVSTANEVPAESMVSGIDPKSGYPVIIKGTFAPNGMKTQPMMYNGKYYFAHTTYDENGQIIKHLYEPLRLLGGGKINKITTPNGSEIEYEHTNKKPPANSKTLKDSTGSGGDTIYDGKTRYTLKKLSDADKKYYERPNKFRKKTKEEVWKKAKIVNGKKVDHNGVVLQYKVGNRSGFDMGHKPGYEYWKHRISAIARQISRKQLLNEHNDPSHYRPESTAGNQSHADEDRTSSYRGP